MPPVSYRPGSGRKSIMRMVELTLLDRQPEIDSRICTLGDFLVSPTLIVTILSTKNSRCDGRVSAYASEAGYPR